MYSVGIYLSRSPFRGQLFIILVPGSCFSISVC